MNIDSWEITPYERVGWLKFGISVTDFHGHQSILAFRKGILGGG